MDVKQNLGGGFKYVFCIFTPILGEDSHFDEYFVNWVETAN